jgi:hypothetical protein
MTLLRSESHVPRPIDGISSTVASVIEELSSASPKDAFMVAGSECCSEAEFYFFKFYMK